MSHYNYKILSDSDSINFTEIQLPIKDNNEID